MSLSIYVAKSVTIFVALIYFSSQVAVIVSSGDAIQPGWLVNHLRSLIPSDVKKFQNSLAQVSLPQLWFSKRHEPTFIICLTRISVPFSLLDPFKVVWLFSSFVSTRGISYIPALLSH